MTDEELIESVAIEVMGWGLFKASGETWACRSKFCDHGENAQCKKRTQTTGDRLLHKGRKYGFFEEGWNPLKDMNHMMMVIEATERKEFIYAFRLVRSYHPNLSNKIWVAQFISAIGTKASMNESIGHAVCLAARETIRSLKKENV